MIDQKIRFCDIFLSVIILITFFPVMLIISILLLLLNGRPIIYKQTRVGYRGKKFFIYKFRTMSQVVFKNEKLRLTYLGKILRKSSLDELPQFINVLNKEMSIVGPRPLPQNIEKKIKKSIKNKRRKVLPGITGMSQIYFTGKKRKLEEKISLDMFYVDNYNFYEYLKIILKTPIVLVIRFFKNKSSIIK